jgi:hypothetical protein
MEIRQISKRQAHAGSKPCDNKCGRTVSATVRFCLACWTEIWARMGKLVADLAAKEAVDAETRTLVDAEKDIAHPCSIAEDAA